MKKVVVKVKSLFADFAIHIKRVAIHIKQIVERSQHMKAKEVAKKPRKSRKPLNLSVGKKSTSISNKITFAITRITVLAISIVGITGIVCLAIISSSTAKTFKENVSVLSPLYKVQYDYMQVRLDLQQMSSSSDTDKADYAAKISEMVNSMNKQLQKYGNSLPEGPSKQNYDTMHKNIQHYVANLSVAENDIYNNDMESFYMFESGQNAVAYSAIASSIDKAFSLNTSMADQNNQTATKLFFVALVLIILCVAVFILISSKRGRKIASNITMPLNKIVDAADAIAAGNLDVDIDVHTNDEIQTLADAFQHIISSLRLLKSDVNTLVDEALEGRLDTRADAQRHKGDYREIIEGVNKTLDAVKEPLDAAFAYIGKIAKGERVENLDNTYKGYYAVLIDNLNSVRDSIGTLDSEAGKLAKAGLRGDLEYRGDEAKLSGIYANIIHGVNDTFDAIKAPLDVASDFIEKMAAGELKESLDNHYQGYYAKLIDNLNEVRTSLYSLISESQKLADSGKRGDLTVRGDTSTLKGGFKEIIDGFNKTLESIVVPLNESRDVLGKMAVNDYTVAMSDCYPGMLNDLSVSINNVQKIMHTTQLLMNNLAKGDTSLLEKFKAAGKLSENDELSPAGVAMMQAIHDLIDESNRLAAAALDGNLDVRSDADKFQGGYSQIIDGMNRMMAAVYAPIEESASVLAEMAQGNLTVGMTGTYNGKYNLIKTSLNQAIESFNELLGAINDAASQVLTGSKQVSDASQSLSQGATEQASSVEELTSSINEITAQIKKNASNATEASGLSEDVTAAAAQGNDKMGEMLDSMNQISESSSNISKIIKVIDDIAFQTNILALNAAVEAARAGQYGKGFAVVAEEVRNLAGKSAQAADETTELIEGSVKKAEAGTLIANQTAEVLKRIVESAKKSSALVSAIAVASKEQATAIAQIDKGVNQVSNVVQTNSATSEESAASSEELSGQANMLMEMVEKFQLQTSTVQSI